MNEIETTLERIAQSLEEARRALSDFRNQLAASADGTQARETFDIAGEMLRELREMGDDAKAASSSGTMCALHASLMLTLHPVEVES